jgi:hypothetical protein
MGLRNPDAPGGYRGSLTRRLQDLVMTPTGSAFLGWKYESPPRPRGLQPQPVYTVSITDVAAGRLLPAQDAKPQSWRTLIQLEGDDLFAMELAHPVDDAAEELPLLSVSKGPLGRATAAAITEAGRFESDEELETRILKVPELYFMALWLKGPRGDSVLPLEDHVSGLEARTHYAPEDVLDLLQPLAAARRAREADPRVDTSEMN